MKFSRIQSIFFVFKFYFTVIISVIYCKNDMISLLYFSVSEVLEFYILCLARMLYIYIYMYIYISIHNIYV